MRRRTGGGGGAGGRGGGVGGVTWGVVLPRRGGRGATRKLLGKTSTMAEQARRTGELVAKTAFEQYQAQAPRAVEALNTVLAQAPQAAEALSGKLPKLALNHRHETAEVTA